MLHSDSGNTIPVKFDPNFITSDRCVIVLDEVNDTCWVWLGRDAGMVNRRTTLRLARSLKRLGYPMKGGNVCVGLKKLVEIDERMDDDETHANIEAFKNALNQKYKLKDDLIAVIDETTEGAKGSKSAIEFDTSAQVQVEDYERIVKPSSLIQEQKPEEKVEPEPYEQMVKPSEVLQREMTEEKVEPELETTTTPVEAHTIPGEKTLHEKLGILLDTVLSAAGLAYLEYQQVDKNNKIIKVDCPELFSFSILIENDKLQIHPDDLGGGETGRKIREEFENKIQ